MPVVRQPYHGHCVLQNKINQAFDEAVLFPDQI